MSNDGNKDNNEGLYSEKEAMHQAIQALYDMLPADADRIEHRGVYLAGISNSVTVVVDRQGQEISTFSTNDVDKACAELRRVMYKPGLGSWFSVFMTVWRDGRARTEYNYDTKPDFGSARGISYLTDLHTYPIDEDKRPEWLKEQVAEGIADLHTYGKKSYPRWLKQMIAEGKKPAWL